MRGIAKYSDTKITKIAWARNIPSHWQEYKIKHVFKIVKRIVGELGYEVLSITQKGIKVKDTTSGEGQLAMDYSKYQLAEIGDFAMNHMDLLTGFVDISKFHGVISPDYRVFKLEHPQSDSNYMLYLMQLCYTQKIFFGHGKGVSMLGRWRLPAENFKNFLIPVPPKNEQIQIARFLNFKLVKIDRFIRKKRKLIKLLNEQKATIINNAVTQGIIPNVEMKESGIEWLGQIPKHWQTKKLKHLANCFPSNIDKHTRNGEKEIRLCNYTDVYRNDFITNEMSLMFASANDEQIEKFSLRKHDVIITKDSETADDIANPALVIEELENVVCGYHLSILRPFKEIYGGYLFRSLQCKAVNLQFELCSNGVTRVGLGIYDLKKAKIPVPPIKEQIEIYSYVEQESQKINTTISKIESEISLTQEYRTALISEAVTGKIDVREFQVPDIQEEQDAYEEIEEELNIAAESEPEYQNEDEY